MATTKPIPKIVLDPTKIGTWNLVRKPPIDPNTVIQGIVRNPASNAFKDHQIKEGIRLRKALQYLTHGRDIFVYHNIRTNQVVYSLTRYLQVCIPLFFSFLLLYFWLDCWITGCIILELDRWLTTGRCRKTMS